MEVPRVSEDYISFERVMRELKIEENELKKLVSAGELRAIRDSEQTKFKKEDIEEYLATKDGSESDAIDLLEGEDLDMGSDSSGEELTEELVFDDLESDEVGMKTEPLSGDDLFSEEEDLEAVSDEAAADDLLMSDDEELLGEDEEEQTLSTPVRKSKIGAADEEEEVEGPAFLALMVGSSLVLIIGVLVVMDIATSDPSPMVEWLVNMFKPA